MSLKIVPKPNCLNCFGTGEVTDWVPMPFGHGNCRMLAFCDCILEQIPEDAPDDVEIEIIYENLLKGDSK